jgi:hypothetical protein
LRRLFTAHDAYSPDDLRSALQAVIDDEIVPRTYSNWNENSFQLCLANALVATFGRNQVYAEVEAGKTQVTEEKRKPGEVKRTDLVVAHPGRPTEASVWELKLVKLDALQLETRGWDAREQFVKNMTEAEVLKTNIAKSGIVGAELEKAVKQVQEWTNFATDSNAEAKPAGSTVSPKAKFMHGVTTLRSFAIVLVGSRVIVKEVPRLPPQPLASGGQPRQGH